MYFYFIFHVQRKVLSVAKLDDFNVFFVRKQWSNMLTRYKQYKVMNDALKTNRQLMMFTHKIISIEQILNEWQRQSNWILT